MKWKSVKAAYLIGGIILVSVNMGCADIKNAYQSYEESKEMSIVADAKKSCARYGFVDSSDRFVECVRSESLATKTREASRSDAMMNSSKEKASIK